MSPPTAPGPSPSPKQPKRLQPEILRSELSDLPLRLEKVLDVFLSKDPLQNSYMRASGKTPKEIEQLHYLATASLLIEIRDLFDFLNEHVLHSEDQIDVNSVFTEKLADRFAIRFKREPIRYQDILLLSAFRGTKAAQKYPLMPVFERTLKTDFSKTEDQDVYRDFEHPYQNRQDFFYNILQVFSQFIPNEQVVDKLKEWLEHLRVLQQVLQNMQVQEEEYRERIQLQLEDALAKAPETWLLEAAALFKDMGLEILEPKLCPPSQAPTPK